jgi:hypothetical protein
LERDAQCGAVAWCGDARRKWRKSSLCGRKGTWHFRGKTPSLRNPCPS